MLKLSDTPYSLSHKAKEKREGTCGENNRSKSNAISEADTANWITFMFASCKQRGREKILRIIT